MKARLGEALAAQPGHAYAFVGPKGIGKTLIAETFAAALLCQHSDRQGACGKCRSCQHFAAESHPDYRRVMLQDKDKTIKVEQVRRQVCGDLPIRPQWGSCKVYLIDAEDLNEAGQNALLKSLEEPPAHARLLLTVDHFQRLLPTIRSRVTPFMLRRLSEQNIEALMRSRGLQPEVPYRFYARFSGGLAGMALDLCQSESFSQLRQETFLHLKALAASSRADLLTQGYQFWEQNKTQAGILLDMLSSMLRDLTVLLLDANSDLLTNEDQKATLQAQPVLKRPRKEAIERLGRANAALLSAQKALVANVNFESLACQTMLALRKELHHA